RLVPVDMDDRSVWLERLPAVELASLPASLSPSPVHRVLGPGRFAPTPTLIAPPGATAVTSRGDEVGELALRDRTSGHREAAHLDRMSPLLVVVDERLRAGEGAEHEWSARPPRVTLEGAASRRSPSPSQRLRPRIAERLPGDDERLVVHVLVGDRQPQKVIGGAGFLWVVNHRKHELAHPVEVVDRF